MLRGSVFEYPCFGGLEILTQEDLDMEYSIILYRDNGKENGNYYSNIGYILGL